MPAMAMEGSKAIQNAAWQLSRAHAYKSYPSRGADGQQQAIIIVVVICMGLLERLAASMIALSRP